ncbi:MAG: MXAN_2562 family outer membrane beta-barrel protein, partial [Polyangiales bacterium]
ELYGERRSVESPERFALELRIGAYTPDVGNAFSIFNGDIGPWIGAEFDVMIARIPYVGLFGVGAAFGWVHYTGSAFLAGSSTSVTEETTLTLFPLSALAVLRVDVLARELRIPFLFTGKLGGDAILWDSNTGSRNVANNVSWGLHWAAQAALELDFLDPGSARTLDSEWGINHSFAFFELFGTTADSTLRLAPKNGFAWSAGLGFIF